MMIYGFWDIEKYKPPVGCHIIVLFWRDRCGKVVQYISIAESDAHNIYVACDDLQYFAQSDKECALTGTEDTEGRQHDCLGEPWRDDIHITHWMPAEWIPMGA